MTTRPETPAIQSAVKDAHQGATFANYAAGILIQGRGGNPTASPADIEWNRNHATGEAISYLSAAEIDLKAAAEKLAVIRRRLEGVYS